jgi:hypothetical protein
MTDVWQLLRENKHHIILAVALSIAIFVGLVTAHCFGVGGIRLHPWTLASGLALAELGKTLTCFGVKKRSWKMEYLGVLAQGLAWWLWSLNTHFLAKQTGASWLFHLLTPAVLLGGLSIACHYATNRLIHGHPNRSGGTDEKKGGEQ